MVARSSRVQRDKIEYSLWLVFREDGAARMVRTAPGLDRGERAMHLSITVPRAIFGTTELRAKIEIADPGAQPPSIDIEAARQALRDVVGCDVDIKVHTQGDQGS